MSFWRNLILKNKQDIGNLETTVANLGGVNVDLVLDQLDEIGAIDYDNTIYTYDGNNNLTTIVWKDSSDVTLRTDSFTYSSTSTTETITQTIAITGGSTTVISTLFDLEGNVLSVDRVLS